MPVNTCSDINKVKNKSHPNLGWLLFIGNGEKLVLNYFLFLS